ncbi:protein NEDD1 [Stigmatopora nigra]
MDDVTRLLSTGDVVKIWDADSMTLLEELDPHGGRHPLTQACWTADNQHLVSANSSGDRLVVSSLKSPNASATVLGEGKGQTRVSLSSSSQFLASGGLDGRVHLWDLRSSKPLRALKDHVEEVTCVSFAANDSLLASGSAGGRLVVHGLATNTSGKAFGHGGQQPVRDLAPSRLKRTLLGSVSEGGWLSLWDAKTQKELHVFSDAHRAPASGLAFSPVSELLLVSVGLDKKIVCYDAAGKIVVRSIRAEAPLTSVDFTPDGSGVLAGSARGHVFYYDLRKSATPVRVTVAHRGCAVTCLRFHNDRHKAGKTSWPRTSDVKSSLARAGGEAPSSVSSPPSAEPDKGPERFPAVGRNSLDVFSPLRPDAGAVSAAGADGTWAAGQAALPGQEAGGPPKACRGSLDCISPLREGPAGGSRAAPPPPRHFAGSHPSSSAVAALPRREASRGSPDLSSPVREASLGAREAGAPKAASHTAVSPLQDGQAEGVRGTPIYHMPVLEEEEPQAEQPEATPPPMEMARVHVGGPTAVFGCVALAAEKTGEAPFTGVQMDIISDVIHRSMEELRELVHKEVFCLQVEMIRQFCLQMDEFHALMSAQKSANDGLAEENRRLREEILRLGANY